MSAYVFGGGEPEGHLDGEIDRVQREAERGWAAQLDEARAECERLRADAAAAKSAAVAQIAALSAEVERLHAACAAERERVAAAGERREDAHQDIRLVQTCGACPEQYEAFVGERRVGYLRMRHGCFTVHYPYVGGELLLETEEPDGDGLFENHEREHFLGLALNAIRSRLWADLGKTCEHAFKAEPGTLLKRPFHCARCGRPE